MSAIYFSSLFMFESCAIYEGTQTKLPKAKLKVPIYRKWYRIFSQAKALLCFFIMFLCTNSLLRIRAFCIRNYYILSKMEVANERHGGK